MKGLLLFLIVALLAAPAARLARPSLYNVLVPGFARFPVMRLPLGRLDAAGQPLYRRIDVSNLDDLFKAHVIAAGPKPEDEFRVVLLGDSAVWGTLLTPDQTLAAQVDALNLRACDGRRVRAYNLGFPGLSAAKDLLILSQALEYEPDLVVWLFSLRTFEQRLQLATVATTIVPDNIRRLQEINARHPLPLELPRPGRWSEQLDASIWGQRRALAAWTSLQLYALQWAATGEDEWRRFEGFTPVQDLAVGEQVEYEGMLPPEIDPARFAFELLSAGVAESAPVPVLLVNEPIYIRALDAPRYNRDYPRWIYDQYRDLLTGMARAQSWQYLDLWDALPPARFTDGALHPDPEGEARLAALLSDPLKSLGCP